MGMIKRKKCRNCDLLFVPDHRNRERQMYCEKPECRRASKAASQRKWLQKPENKDHFKGPVNVQRVQEWRKHNPGYWKNRSKKEIALQETLNAQDTENNKDNNHFESVALQDLLKAQPAVIIGLISNFIGSALQDDIAQTLLRMQQSGQDILYKTPKMKGGNHDCENTHFTRTGP
ncbi:MAG: hypothetical protein JRE28_16345 [Deltaproteobacteria bacterium]|nr:hypothetical protein [Deltaproteobacteria bacterium]